MNFLLLVTGIVCHFKWESKELFYKKKKNPTCPEVFLNSDN